MQFVLEFRKIDLLYQPSVTYSIALLRETGCIHRISERVFYSAKLYSFLLKTGIAREIRAEKRRFHIALVDPFFPAN